ncbi:hypothetical protein ACEPAF_8970 [Sanghuangporus sanghuang]
MIGPQTVKGIFLCNNTHANENVSHTVMPQSDRRYYTDLAYAIREMSPGWLRERLQFSNTQGADHPYNARVYYNRFCVASVPDFKTHWDMEGQPSSQLVEHVSDKLQTIHIEHRESPSSSLGSRYDNSQEASTPVSTTSASAPLRMNIGDPFWTHRVSASFNAMADQIAAASQAIAQIPPLPDTQITQLQARMEEISDTQEKLQSELEELRQQIRAITEGPEKFQQQLDDCIAEFRLEQQRLPARLHNALATVSKGAIKPVADNSGKNPPLFPATRGEFEHLTKERYEGLMKAYGLPIQGDLAAKRNVVRSFIGLPQFAVNESSLLTFSFTPSLNRVHVASSLVYLAFNVYDSPSRVFSIVSFVRHSDLIVQGENPVAGYDFDVFYSA